MSQVRVFSLIGDSNIRGHINKTSCKANPSIRAAQVLTCGHLGIFRETLLKTRPESNVCIMSCITNFLSSSTGPDSISQRIDPVLQDIREVLAEVCEANPERSFLVSPPMYRVSPVWYREGLPEVLTTFSQVLTQDKPPNLHLLSSFPTPAYQDDGIHLTPYSGLEFLLHLFEGADDLLEGLALAPEAVQSRASESTRVLEDRVMALEQDHRRLNKVVENKIAIDSEIADYRDNEANQDWFVIAGMPQIPAEIVGKPWQERAVSDVSDVIKTLMGKSLDILFVSNSTQRYKDAEVTYSVRMRHVADSKAIRDKFGSFFLGGSKKKPEALSQYSIRNRVTPETKIRIHILQVLARRYRAANSGSKVQVVGYDPRPRIKITPAAGASDPRVKVYNFIEAVKILPTNFTESELDFIFKKVSLKFSGKLRSLFICLSDDEFKRRKDGKAAKGPTVGNEEVAPNEINDNMSESGSVSTPLEVVPAPSGSRTQKRGASSPPDGAASAKK